MNEDHPASRSAAWRTMARATLRIAFGIIWAVNAALTWTADFSNHYVGYLHNAAHGQPEWSAWWFDMWIAVVTPHPDVFIWLTRFAETAIAIALIFGLGRKTLYAIGALFSLLIWSTAEGFGGPYAIGATNMGAAITYVLIFIALIAINSHVDSSPYSLDYYIEKRWPFWRRIAEWRTGSPVLPPSGFSWQIHGTGILGLGILLALLIAGIQSSTNVTPPTPKAAAAAVSPLSLKQPGLIAEVRDPRLPPVPEGDVVNVHLVSTNHNVTIANGVENQAWTFNNSVPGPIIHVRQGQKVNITFTNKGTMQHSIDFHAAHTPPNLHFKNIMPGETLTFSFIAKVPGAFLYHCGTAPLLLHLGNGMYGAIIVDPAEPLPPADRSYVIVQSEWYTKQVAGNLMGPDFDKMLERDPDEVVFNGIAFQYHDQPLPATVGERVRLYFINAGPNLFSSFHIVGAIFNKVYPDAVTGDALTGVSSYTVGPGSGAIMDVVFKHPGKYPFVDHAAASVSLGAAGMFDVRPADQPEAQMTFFDIPPVGEKKAAQEEAPSGPYEFDPQKGTALYASTCAACHQASGEGMTGIFPPLKGSKTVLDDDPTHQISVILYGLQGQAIDGVTYSTPMPPFANILTDTQIAHIINHERTSWGNQAKLVTPDDVRAIREKTK